MLAHYKSSINVSYNNYCYCHYYDHDFYHKYHSLVVKISEV